MFRTEEKKKARIDIATVSDYRTMLSLLPGKLLARKHLEREIGEIRLIVRGGEHREWLALLPGLESEIAGIDEALGVMSAALGTNAVNGMNTVNGVNGAYGRHGNVEPDGDPERGRKQLATPHKDAAVLSEIFDKGVGFGIYRGKPIRGAVMLAELIKYPLNRKEFVNKLGADSDVFKGSGFHSAIRWLASRGVKISKIKGVIGRYALRTKITGEWPAELADHPFMQKVLLQGAEEAQIVSEPAAAEIVEPKQIAESAKPEPVNDTPPLKHHPSHKFTGSWAQILLQEFDASTGIVNLRKLEKKYRVSPYTFHFPMSKNKSLHNAGYRFEKVRGKPGSFRMIKKGKGVILIHGTGTMAS